MIAVTFTDEELADVIASLQSVASAKHHLSLNPAGADYAVRDREGSPLYIVRMLADDAARLARLSARLEAQLLAS